MYGSSFFWIGLSNFLVVLLQIGEGYFLSRLLEWFQVVDITSNRAYFYCAAVSLCLILHAFIDHMAFFIGGRTGMRLRVGLIAAIYRKCLLLSVSNACSTGFIVNLVSNDVQKFEDAAPFANFIWLGPIQMVLITYFIYMEIGLSCFASVGAILILIPLQSHFAKRFGALRKYIVEYRDERIKNISDMLSGIMLVKLYAWEVPFMNRISEIRNSEMKYIRSGSILKAITEYIFFSSSGIFNLM